MVTFGGVSKGTSYRQIRQASKKSTVRRKGWTLVGRQLTAPLEELDEENAPNEQTPIALASSSAGSDEGLTRGSGSSGSKKPVSIAETEDAPSVALKAMFTENKINVLLVFLPLSYWSHAAKWSDGSVFIITFLAMVPLASMLGEFTEELAAHTNDAVGGLINATFGNAVELVVAIQALLANDFVVVQSSLLGSVFSNLLLVLGMCFFMGGLEYPEQKFIPEGAVASVALLAFTGLTLLMPQFFGVREEGDRESELAISRIGSLVLILMYLQLMYFQLHTHVHLFEGDGDVVQMIPFSWALIGLVLITAVVTLLSEWLVASINGFCEEFNLGVTFVGVIILPVVGNAVEHISAVTVAMKNKMDLALGVALGSAVQISLFVLPVLVVIGWFTGRDLSLKFPPVAVYVYLLSVFIVSLCVSNHRTNWLEGSLLVFTYLMVAVGVYFE